VHSKNSDPVREALEVGVSRVLAEVEKVSASNPVVAIDGRSGAGKTTLARLLVERWPLLGHPQLIALDSIYPGWEGLSEGSDRAYEQILYPHGRNVIGSWQRYDWPSATYAESHAVDPARAVVIEGCGVLTARNARVADVRVWVSSPATSRKARALGRDGDAFRPYWEQWGQQEERHIRQNSPHELASVRVEIP